MIRSWRSLKLLSKVIILACGVPGAIVWANQWMPAFWMGFYDPPTASVSSVETTPAGVQWSDQSAVSPNGKYVAHAVNQEIRQDQDFEHPATRGQVTVIVTDANTGQQLAKVIHKLFCGDMYSGCHIKHIGWVDDKTIAWQYQEDPRSTNL